MPISTWIISSSTSPCPVCGRVEDGDCLTASDNITVLCHSKVSQSGRRATPPDQINGWNFTGKVETNGVVSRAVYVNKSSSKPQYVKPVRPKSEQIFLYPDSNGRNIARTKRVDDGKGGRFIWQEYWIKDDRLRRHRPKTKDESNSFWVCVSEKKVQAKKATPDERRIYQEIVAELQKSIHLYRISEARQLSEETGLPVLVVEGEPIVNNLLKLGIPATTNIGGSLKWDQYGGKHGNYAADLDGIDAVVLCPDCDQVGIQHMERVAQDINKAKWLYANPKHKQWQNPEGGYDLNDWVEEMRLQGLNNEQIKEQILGAIGEKRESVQPAQKDLLASMFDTAGDDGQPVHKLVADYALICNTLGNRLRFNTLKNAVELDGQPLETETAKQELVIEHNLWLKSGKEEIADLVAKAAKRNPYNPIEDYLNYCHKTYGDDTSILFRFAQRYFGQSDPIYTIFVIRFLIGAVARVFEPGCKFDTALILQGGQGIRKSTFFKVLASSEWFDDSLGNVSDKDEKMKLYQTWFMEWAELETVFKRKDVSSTKSFLSSATDRLRVPYGRSIVEMKRRCVIVGTTNQDEFLNDVTGNRRFWVVPVKVPCIDTSTLAEERDRIWAAAVALYRRGEFWHLIQCEDQAAGNIAEEYQSEDAWMQPIQKWLSSTTASITTANILSQGLQLEIGRQDKAAQMRVSDIMKSLGWEKIQKRINGEKVRAWVQCPNRPNLSQPKEDYIDLSQSSLLQGFYTILPQPSQLSQPGLENLKKFVESVEPSPQNGNGKTPEKIPLSKTPVPVGTVGTTQVQQDFNCPSQVGTPDTKSNGRLGHYQKNNNDKHPPDEHTQSNDPVLKVGDRVQVPTANGPETGVIEEINAEGFYRCSGEGFFAWFGPSEISLIE